MTISIKPTASGSTIEQDGSTILTVDGSGNISAENNFTATGHVLQVVQSTYTSSTTIASGTDVSTGHTLSITPSSTSSKILIRYSFNWGQKKSVNDTQDNMKRWTIYRNSTNLAPANSYFFQHQNQAGTAIDFDEQTAESVIEYLDSPNTTSAVTYALYGSNDNPSQVTMHYNRRGLGAQLGVCVAIAMEIAG